MRRLVVCVALCMAVAAPALADTVLRINGVAVSRGELDGAKRALGKQAGLDDAQRTRVAVDQLISRVLLVQAAKEAKVSVDEAAMKAALDRQAATFGGAEAREKAAAELGFSLADMQRLETDRVLIQRFIETKVAAGIEVGEAELRSYYDYNPHEFEHPDEVRIRMILATPKGSGEEAEAEARARAEAAAKRLKAGEDFAALASEVSDDPTRTVQGLVGWVRPGMLLPELDGPVFALAPGAVSGVLKSQYGFHLFKLEERRAAGRYGFEDAKERVRAMIREKRVRTEVQRLVAERRAKATIEALDPVVKTAIGASAAPAPVRP